MASSARIDELRKKFEENPRRYFAPLANEYRKAGDIEQAISICREYLPQQPGHMSGHIVYGQALYEARQYEEARTVFETALALDPENLIALRHLGDIALIVGDIESAKTWYGRVLEADPRNEEIQAQLASLGTVTSGDPTPMSAPAVQPADAPEAAAAPPPPASSAPTAVVSAMPMPAVERTVELPATAVPSAGPESLSTAPTTEITLDQVPVPGVPDLEKLTPAEASAGQMPVEKTAEFEPTAETTASQPPAVPPAAGLETTAAAPSEAPPLEAVRLEGLETTSMSSPAQDAQPPAPPDVAPIPELELAPAPPAAAETAVAPESPASSAPEQPAAEVAPQRTPEPVVAQVPPSPGPEAVAPEGPLPSESEPAASTAVPVGPGPAAVDVPAAPAPPTSDLPFLDLGDAGAPKPESVATTDSAAAPEAAPPPSTTVPEPVVAPEPPMAESKPFVTETMAELYEQQGHREEALRVYRELQEQRPNDEHIRARVEQLEGKRGPTIRELLTRVATRRPPAVVTPPRPASEAAASPPADAQAPAAAEAPRPVMATPSVARSDTLGQLFGGPRVSGADENAAVTLAAAFSSDQRDNGGGSSTPSSGAPARPASKDLSLDAVFGNEAAGRSGSGFSFDQFFSQRATAEQPIPGGRPGIEGAGQETKDDVAKFTQWLEGLKQR